MEDGGRRKEEEERKDRGKEKKEEFSINTKKNCFLSFQTQDNAHTDHQAQLAYHSSWSLVLPVLRPIVASSEMILP